MPTSRHAISIDEQIDQRRSYLRRRKAVNSAAAELEDQLRTQMAGLVNAGLAHNKGFLVAMKQRASNDAISKTHCFRSAGAQSLMKNRISYAILLTVTLLASSYAQTLDKAKLELKLSDALDKFFPQIPNAQKITIAQILGHRSGIPNSRPASKTNAVTRDELLAIVAKGTPEFEPGTKHSYSIGIYSTPGAPAKATVTREGATLFFQPPGAASAVPLEATAADKFQIEGAVVLSFDAARKQMTVKRRGGGERVFTKEE